MNQNVFKNVFHHSSDSFICYTFVLKFHFTSKRSLLKGIHFSPCAEYTKIATLLHSIQLVCKTGFTATVFVTLLLNKFSQKTNF